MGPDAISGSIEDTEIVTVGKEVETTNPIVTRGTGITIQVNDHPVTQTDILGLTSEVPSTLVIPHSRGLVTRVTVVFSFCLRKSRPLKIEFRWVVVLLLVTRVVLRVELGASSFHGSYIN